MLGQLFCVLYLYRAAIYSDFHTDRAVDVAVQ